MADILIEFIGLVALLFFVPKLLSLRLNFPPPASELLLGAILGPLALDYLKMNDTIRLLSTIGIIALFFFAGLEVKFTVLKKRRHILLESLVLQLLLLAAVAIFVQIALRLNYIVALLVALSLTTPSAGFIISAMRASKWLSKAEKSWIETHAITAEVLALSILMFFINFSNGPKFISAASAIALVVLLLPKVLTWVYNDVILKMIGESGFSFLFVVAFASAYLTELVGAHYIIGAFVSGLVVRGVVGTLPKTVSDFEPVPSAFNFFAIFFAPFYFFSVGLALTREMFTFESLAFGLGLYMAIVPIKTIVVGLYRKLRIGEHAASCLKISVMTTPTILFTLVVATILYERFGITEQLFGTLVFYGILTTLFPDLVTERINQSKKWLSRFM